MLWVQLLCESFCRSRLWVGRLVRSWRTAGSGIPRSRSSASLGRPTGCSPVEGTSRDVLGALAGEPGMLAGGGGVVGGGWGLWGAGEGGGGWGSVWGGVWVKWGCWPVVERSWVCVVSLVCPSRCTTRWRNQYGGLKADDAKRGEELGKQNVMLKRLLAEAELEKAVLKELAGGNF